MPIMIAETLKMIRCYTVSELVLGSTFLVHSTGEWAKATAHCSPWFYDALAAFVPPGRIACLLWDAVLAKCGD